MEGVNHFTHYFTYLCFYFLNHSILPESLVRIFRNSFRWGDEASLTAHEALYATGHTSLAALQLWDLGPRSVAGRAARKAGIQFVSDLHRRSSPHLEDMDKKNV